MFPRLVRRIPLANVQNSVRQRVVRNTSSMLAFHQPIQWQIQSMHTNRNDQSWSSKIGMLTGNMQMTTNESRIMQRVWEKRQKKLTKATDKWLTKFRDENLKIKSVELYIRQAGSFDDSEDNAQRDVHISLRGIAHTSVILKAENELVFLLDRVVEGIRLTELPIDENAQKIQKCNKFKPDEMLKINSYDIDLTSKQIAEFIEEEAKRPYHVLLNSFVQFAMYFHARFLYAYKLRKAYRLWTGGKLNDTI